MNSTERWLEGNLFMLLLPNAKKKGRFDCRLYFVIAYFFWTMKYATLIKLLQCGILLCWMASSQNRDWQIPEGVWWLAFIGKLCKPRSRCLNITFKAGWFKLNWTFIVFGIRMFWVKVGRFCILGRKFLLILSCYAWKSYELISCPFAGTICSN